MNTFKKIVSIFLITSSLFPYFLHGMYVNLGPTGTKIHQMRQKQRAKKINLEKLNTPNLSEKPIEKPLEVSIEEPLETPTKEPLEMSFIKVTIPDIIAENSKFLKNMVEDLGDQVEDLGDQKITEFDIPNTDQETVNFLAKVYETPLSKSSNLESESINTLVKAINLEAYLLMTPNSETAPQLKTILMNKIIKDQLSEDHINSIQNLNLDITKELIKELINPTKIEAHLLEKYQEALKKHPTQFSMPTNIDDSSYTNKILFFNDDKVIYSSSHDSENTIYTVDRKNPDNKKSFNFKGNEKRIFCNFNGSLCLFLPQPYSAFKVLDLETQTIIKNNINLPLKRINGDWCFASNDTLCIINPKGEVSLLNLLNNETNRIIEQPLQINFNQNETPKDMACIINNNKLVLLIVPTNKNRIYLYNKNINLNQFIDSQEEEFDPFSFFRTTSKIHIDNAKKSAYIIRNIANNTKLFYNTKLLSINLHSNSPSINEIAKLSLPTDSMTNLTISNDKKLLTVFSIRESLKASDKPAYNFVLTKTNFKWQNKTLDSNCQILAISENGRESIEKCSGTYSDSYNFITLYDDNMAVALDYFNTEKSAPQKQLLEYLLISTILNKSASDKPIFLNQAETEIYQKYLPKEIQTMLAKIISDFNEQLSSTDTFSSLKNKAAAWYSYFFTNKK
jgi:hypothetical protein